MLGQIHEYVLNITAEAKAAEAAASASTATVAPTHVYLPEVSLSLI